MELTKSTFLQEIEKHELFSKNDRLIVAVSGGIDSIVMADLLIKCSFTVILAHCNFNLRGEESLRDENFVKNFADKKGIILEIKNFDTQNYADQKNISIQEAARELRYQWFYELLVSNKASYILTAHHADDLAENILIKLGRGEGPGLWNSLKRQSDKLIRPLLSFSRKEIIKYATLNLIQFAEDSSNNSDYYTRNFYRNQVIPLIESKQNNFSGNLVKHALILQKERKKIEEMAEDWLKSKRVFVGTRETIAGSDILNAWFPDSYVHYWLRDKGFSFSILNDIMDAIKQNDTLSFHNSSFLLTYSQGWLSLEPNEESEEFNLLIPEPDFNIKINNYEFRSGILAEDSAWFVALPPNISFPLMLRKWNAGDQIKLLGLNAYKSVSDILQQEKIPYPQRKEVLVLLDAQMEIISLLGYRNSEKTRVEKDELNTCNKFIFLPSDEYPLP